MQIDKVKKDSAKTIYHYTSQEGLIGIITQKILYCTEITYLNDSIEFRYCIDFFRQLAKEKSKELSVDKNADILQKVLEFLDNPNKPGISQSSLVFVFCFSSEKDLLSQWRGYCTNNGMFCIGFNVKKLDQYAKGMNYRLLKCIYAEEVHKDKLNAIIESCIFLSNNIGNFINDNQFDQKGINAIRLLFHEDAFGDDNDINELLKNSFDHLILNIAIETYLKILTIAPQFKKTAFQEENEWRLVSRLVWDPSLGSLGIQRITEKIKFRPGNTMIIPYVEFNLSEDKNDNYCIDEIVAGPNSRSELSRKSLKIFLSKNGLASCKIDVSRIPFRSW